MEQTELKRGLGLGGTVSILIGFVIGASIFILISPLAENTGPALWVTYLIASIPAIFMCFTSAQVGSALPVAGANYVLMSRTVKPFWGFLGVWGYIVTMAVVLPILAYGFAIYLEGFIEGISIFWTAVAVIVVFGVINILGITLAGWAQVFLTVTFMLALFVFGIGGLFNINPEFASPLFANGVSPVFENAIEAYFSFTGFMVIVELGGEVKNPAKNIPRSLLIAFFAVLITYTLVAFAFTSVVDWSTLEATEATLVDAARTFYPGWVANFIGIGALFASITTINAIMATAPRVVFAFGRDKIFPGWIAATSKRFKTPYVSIIIFMIAGILGTCLGLFGVEVIEYAFISVGGIMFFHILIAIGVLRLRKKLPEHYEKSPFKLKGFFYYFWPIGTIVIGIIYILAGFALDAKSLIIYFVALFLIVPVYFWRKALFEKKGTTIAEVFEKDVDGVLKSAKDAH